MSIIHTVAVWRQDDLPATEKLVLLCFADFAGPAGLVRPSRAAARRCGLSEEPYLDACDALEERGHIERVDGQYRAYRLTVLD